ncbi:hypothetical protein FOMPIDRAFT_161441 [Fomitopsis schrenkii]|uniref:LysM domain-containing protein n=1 Tax=Fomitopsis schrenkii TaxID=2126942 RepID=S8F884_FOMSC|nr:hypothetical protein FOMPIDRAFT_161441 [Fomitopsis schrenkii]
MGRWTQYDEDEYRLPDGMKRVGYDADTSKYYYRDADGALWEGPAGAQYGELTQVSSAPIALDDDGHSSDDDLEAAPTRADGYKPLASDVNQPAHYHSGNIYAYRMLFPFLLVVAVVLLLVIRLAFYNTSSDVPPPHAALCPNGSEPVQVQAGDTCWNLSQARNSTLEEFLNLNPTVDCNSLMPGQNICLPTSQSTA